MTRLWWFLLGIGFAVLVGGIGAFILLRTGNGFSAQAKPSALETVIATKARAMALPTGAKDRANPVENSPQAIADGRAHWADHCAVCHANNGSGDAEMGKRMYPPAPDMRKPDTQQLSDGELFYIIENGIRLSGMPAWGDTEHGEEDSWKLVRFIRHLPELSRAEQQEMQKLNPKGPDERDEEKQEEQFLKGDKTDASKPRQHHH